MTRTITTSRLAAVQDEATKAAGIGDGITVRVLNGPTASSAELSLALRTLARLLVRRHRQKGDCVPNAAPQTRSSSLTVVRDPSPHHEDEIV
jgi:hypothetical protein